METCIMSCKIYVGDIPFQVSSEDLTSLFESCGNIINVHIPTDRDTGRPRGFAFIEFDIKEEAEAAVSQLNGINLGGRNISVALAVERDPSAAPKPYAKEIGTGDCILCNTTTFIPERNILWLPGKISTQ
jgi:RNA recognition motif-containing protein